MRTIFVGSCAKELDSPEANEDAYAFSADLQRYVLSDGASESYDSQLWAKLLVSKFTDEGLFSDKWLATAITDYQAQHDFSSMSWSQQLAYERGCFGTLLSVEHDYRNDRLIMFAVGDTVAVLLIGLKVVHSWPLDDPERFKDRPTLLSTLSVHNEFTLCPEFNTLSQMDIDLKGLPDPTLLCMTDALGEWTLRMAREDPQRLLELLAIRSEEQLAILVLQERVAKRMRVDDSTLAIFKFDNGEDVSGLPQP